MSTKANAPKRKAVAPPSGENKSARTSNSSDAPTSKRQGLCLATLTPVFHVSFIVSTNKPTTVKGAERGKYFPFTERIE